MTTEDERRQMDRFVREIDRIAVPEHPTASFARSGRISASGAVLALAALALAVVFVAVYVSNLPPSGVTTLFPGTSSPGATVDGSATAPAASFDPRFARILWMYVPDRKSIVFEQESRAGVISEMRLVRVADTAVVAAFPVRLAQPGEPRVCGTPDVSPALVGAMPANDDVLQDLRRAGGPLRYRLEARTSATDSWFAVQLLDWSKLAGGPCFQ